MKISHKSIILRLLKEHPEGLTVNRIADLYLKERSASPDTIHSTVSKATCDGFIRISREKSKCEHCGANRQLYHITNAGDAWLKYKEAKNGNT